MLNETMLSLGTCRSCIRDLFEYGLMRAQIVGKENVYDYSLGNPSVPTPRKVQVVLKDLIERDDGRSLHGYTSAAGLASARAAIAEDMNARYHTALKAENFFITCGAAPALTAALSAVAVEGSEVIAFAPYFPEYSVFVRSNGHRFVPVEADRKAFQINFEDLERKLSPRTQAVIVNSPNNPSGAIYTRETLEKLAAVLTAHAKKVGHPVYLFSDEPYRELVYDNAELPFIPAIYPDTVICYSWSKSLSLPGERLGYVCVPDSVTDGKLLLAAVGGAARAQGHVCAPASMQYMVARCVSLRPDIEAYDRNRMTLYNALTSYGYECVKPQGAFYLFVKAPGGSSKAFSEKAKEKDLLIVPGDDFGCPEYFRISTCVSYDMIVKSLPVFEELVKQSDE